MAKIIALKGVSQQFDRILFPYSPTYVTRGVMETFSPDYVGECLMRHACGDWGDLDEFDKRQNDEGLLNGARLLSAYVDPQGAKLWIITEADRSATTALLPSEY